jgi:hypothetical protein
MAGELQSDARRCFMSFKLLQFSPQTSTRTIRIQAMPDRWTNGYTHPCDMGLGGSWRGDFESSERGKSGMNWGAISGLAISLAVSCGFWAGMGYLISRIVH